MTTLRATSPVLALALVASAAFCWFRLQICPELDYASYWRIFLGTAETPFQHRVLVALIGHGLTALRHLGDPVAPPVDPTIVIDVLSLTLVLAIGAVYARRLGLSAWWAAALYVMILVNYVGPFGYNMRECYDMPALLFALAATLALRDGRLRLFYAILPIALVNRESAAFLTILFALTQANRMPRRALIRHLAVQIALIAVIKGAVLWVYRDSPGPGALSFFVGHDYRWTESRLHDNLWYVARLQVVLVFGGLWAPLLVLRRRLIDRFTRRALWLVPIVFAAMMLVGNVIEFRIYTELVPIIFLGLLSVSGQPEAASVTARDGGVA